MVVGLALAGAALLLMVGLALAGAALLLVVGLALAGAALLLMVGLALAGAALLLVVGLALLLVVGLALLLVVGLGLAGAALLLVVRLALAGAEVVMKEDVCASSTSSPSESSKNSFPTSSAIYVTDRVLKQLVKNLPLNFFQERNVLFYGSLVYTGTCTATFSSCAIILLV